jgi:dihydrofolate reductase
VPAQPLLTLVVAVSENGVIGRDGGLPWHLPEDLRRFKAATLGKPVVMGRRTFDSIGRALPGRHNIVLTRRADFRPADPGVSVAHDLDGALRAAGDVPEIMIIGGAEVYALSLPRAGRILLTRVHARIEGDTVFAELDPAQWRVASREHFPADSRHPHAMTFEELQRLRTGIDAAIR